jgi:L-ascorbate metabolism protein UlaG (beta-lactamase superfamily)
MMDRIRVTHIGGPTTLIEIGPWRLLTDPTFDPPGRRYGFGWGSSSTKLAGPAIAVGGLPAIDAVLLSHDQHADNLDDAGRALLPRARHVVTTVAGARRLRGSALGLAPWQEMTLAATDKPPIRITATPCRHGAPLVAKLAGDVIGFALQWEGQQHGALWISGDTVVYDGVREVPTRLPISALLLHLGGVHFGITGALRYTARARELAAFAQMSGARTVVPIHYEGWSHFEGTDAYANAMATLPPSLQHTIQPISPGATMEILI